MNTAIAAQLSRTAALLASLEAWKVEAQQRREQHRMLVAERMATLHERVYAQVTNRKEGR